MEVPPEPQLLSPAVPAVSAVSAGPEVPTSCSPTPDAPAPIPITEASIPLEQYAEPGPRAALTQSMQKAVFARQNLPQAQQPAAGPAPEQERDVKSQEREDLEKLASLEALVRHEQADEPPAPVTEPEATQPPQPEHGPEPVPEPEPVREPAPEMAP